MLVTEQDLDAFRRDHLSPVAILRLIAEHVRVLVRLGVGVGKSVAVDGLLAAAATFHRFDLVMYVAPSWDILNERPILAGRIDAPVPWMVLRPRPIEDCGGRAEEWASLEMRACSAFGKATLCRPCQQESGDACFWPRQIQEIEGIRLIFLTEQQLLLNRSLVHVLMSRTGARRVLMILDEARLLDTCFEMLIGVEDLQRFRDVVETLVQPSGIPIWFAKVWCARIDEILAASSDEIESAQIRLPPALNRHAYKIQAKGLEQFGDEFLYLGYDIAQLGFSRAGERWKDEDGAVRFIARPYLGCHVLILSAHLRADYVAHRLGVNGVASPYEDTGFRHSATRIINLRSRTGADRYFGRNKKQILDTIAVLIARNVSDGRTTLLVSRKKTKGFCAEYLADRLAGWGLKIRFECEDYRSLPSPADAAVVPVIHYGIRGVNSFSEYECAYALNSYYVSDRELNRTVQEFESDSFRVKLKILSGPHRRRHVAIEKPAASDPDRLWLAELYLRRFEVDPAIQALGRCRFLTRPREVVFFQMNDLAADLGEVEEVGSLVALRAAMGVPSPKEVDEFCEAKRVGDLMAKGKTGERAAAELGVSRRTAFRRLGAVQSARFPYTYCLRVFGTPAGGLAEPGRSP